MSNIIDFPKKEERIWLELEKNLRQILREGGIAREVEETIIGRMKAAFESEQFSLSIQLAPPRPASITEVEWDVLMEEIIGSLREQLGDFLDELFRKFLIQQFGLYVEMYCIRGGIL